MSHRVAVVPGDGIGPEVIAEALKVTLAAGAALITTEFDLGAERYLEGGEVLRDDELSALAGSDAILFGAVGDPRVEPGVLEVGLLLRLRQELDLYVNLRPARLFDGVAGPLEALDEIDIVIVRENTEGLYSGRGQAAGIGTSHETATEVSINTMVAARRVIRYGFELASQTRRSLTLVHKTNVLQRAGGLYRRAFDELAAEFPRVETGYQHADAAALLMVTDPQRFSVMVTDNLFGDILSDLAAALVGGLGFVGSGNINPAGLGLFEPVHGSAPNIAGTGRANPIGAILSAAMMLRHLGETHMASTIENAVASTAGKIADAEMTTSEAGDLIAEAVS